MYVFIISGTNTESSLQQYNLNFESVIKVKNSIATKLCATFKNNRENKLNYSLHTIQINDWIAYCNI